jgi:phosphoribosylglycinamide formyltransferase-1
LIDAVRGRRLDAAIGIVISSRAGAAGLDRAREAGIDALCLEPGAFTDRDDYDRALVRELRSREVGLICLAGFMRVIGSPMLDAYPNRILNIHPSLLPAFPGLHPQRQALAHGVRVSGVTVHLVDRHLDGGPIVVQRTVPVLDTDTPDTLAARILVEEHRAYPEAVDIVLRGGWHVDGRRFVRAEVSAG